MKFTINGKEYNSVELELGTICDLEELGISLDMLDKAHFTFLRGYFMLCSKMNKSDATRELQSHVINGGSLDELAEAVKTEIENSGFFQAASKKAEKENSERATKKK